MMGQRKHTRVAAMILALPLPLFLVAILFLCPYDGLCGMAEDLSVFAQESDVSPNTIERLCEFGDMVPQQNLQQLFYKTACAGFAVLGDTNRYLLIPSSETGVAQWKKGKVLTSRDWIGTVDASSALDGFPNLMNPVIYRSVSEFRQFNPQGQE